MMGAELGKGADPKNARRALAALLKFLAGGHAEIFAEEGGHAETRLLRQDGRVHTVTAGLLLAAISRGLAVRQQDLLSLSAPGRAALKRWMTGGEDAFASQHRHIETRSDGAGGTLAVNLAESPLASLGRLKRRDGTDWFGRELIASGDRLRADFTRGVMMPSVTSRWEPAASRGNAARSSGVTDLTDAALAARQRVAKALGAVGPELSGLLVDVCCHLKGLETVERERLWPQRSAKLMLRAGLEMLARHYDPPRPAKNPRMRGWAGEGYRPEIGPDPIPVPAPARDAPRP